MPLLTLRFKGRVLKEYPIEMGQTLTIGRNDSSDIVIDNLAVSGNHARIDSVSATFIITDLESTNGTFVNRELVSSHGLRHHDQIMIGKHELLFDRSDLDRKPTDQEDSLDEKTRHLDTAEYRDLINKTQGKPKTPQQTVVTRQESEEKRGFFSRIFRFLFG